MAAGLHLSHGLELAAEPRSAAALPGRALRPGLTGFGAMAFAAIAATSGAAAVVTLHYLAGWDGRGGGLRQQAKPGEVIAPAEAMTLARSVLLRLEDANRTGNYKIFREAAASSFQSINKESDLARIFAWMRNKGVSLAGAALLDGSEMAAPVLEPGGILHLRGAIVEAGEPLNFDLLFEKDPSGWRLFGLAVYRG